MSKLAANRAYLDKLMEGLDEVPAAMAIEWATRIFEEVVWATRFDSGQAALNWHLQPFSGSGVQYEAQQMMWGYGDVAPISPAGFKWSGGANEDQLKANLILDRAMQVVLLNGQQFDGISIYNPITPGFAGFTPGDDEYYWLRALGQVYLEENDIVSRTKNEAEAAVASRYDFVRVG